MSTPKRLLIHIGILVEAQRREANLRALATSLGFVTRRGKDTIGEIGNISALIQGIADGELIVTKTNVTPKELGD